MTEDGQKPAEGSSSTGVDTWISNILKPTLQDNDFLQSFVRVSLDDNSDTKRPKEGSLSSKSGASKHEKGSRRLSRVANDRKQNGRAVMDALELEVKEQRSRKKRRRKSEIVLRQEEVYTDKDRAAAVNLGSRDIKQSLKIKRRQDRSRALQIPEEADPGAILALGCREMRAGNVETAVGLINKALEMSPSDKKALIARSKCHLLLGKPDKALQDAESALEGKLKDIDKSRAIFCKAEALFHLGDLEMSLVYYHRGMRIRPDYEQFRLGVQKAKEAIQNILNNQVIQILPEHMNQYEVGHNSIRPQTSVSRITTISDASAKSCDFDTKDSNSNKSEVSGKAKKGAKIKVSEPNLLGRLNVDKKYLENLVKKSDIKIPYQDSMQHIIAHAEEGINFLKTRQEFWRQQRAQQYYQRLKD